MFHIIIVWYVSYLRSHDMSCDLYIIIVYCSFTVEYLSPNVEHSKCYCHSCFRGESDVKFSGDPPEKYSVPVQWVKFGLR